MRTPFRIPPKGSFKLLQSLGFRVYPKGPSSQIVGFQGPKTIQSMDFGT